MTQPPRCAIAFAPAAEEELASLGPSGRTVILRAVLKQLAIAPEQYGQPLGGDLAGFFKLRVRHYRVVYHVEHARVYVLVLAIGRRAAGHKSDVYESVSRALLESRRRELRATLSGDEATGTDDPE